MTQGVMDKAQKALASARILLDAGDMDGAANRAYYAMFDAAVAALSWAGAGADTGQSPPKTHSGLITSFGNHLVRTGKLAPEFGRALTVAPCARRRQRGRNSGKRRSAATASGMRKRSIPW